MLNDYFTEKLLGLKDLILLNIENFTDTFRGWLDEILNAYDTGFTNGYTEGCNNKIKVLKRNAYGVKDFQRFRKRIMHIMNSPL